MDDPRHVLAVVGSRVLAPESRRLLAVELDRPHLPRPPHRVVHEEVDLGPVERAVALLHPVRDPLPLERRAQYTLRVVPLLVRPELRLRPGRELRMRELPNAQAVVEEADELEHPVDLVLDLLLRAVHVRVVLVHLSHPQEAVQRPGRLVAVQGRRLGVTDRQLAVAAELAREQEHVPGAVHRLEAKGVLAMRDEEEGVVVLLPVARALPELDVPHERRPNLEVAALGVLASP